MGIELAHAFVLSFCLTLEAGSHCGAQVVLKLLLLPQSLDYWDYRHEPPNLASSDLSEGSSIC